MINSRGLRRLGLVVLGLLSISGCATIAGIRPAPEDVHWLEPELTVGIPDEQPMPPIRTEGLSSSEIETVTVYRDNIRAVVNVTSLSMFRNRFQGHLPVSGTGSGFIVDQSGHVVTNYHVIKGGQSLIITMYDGSNYRARMVGYDPDLDLAVLQFDPQGRTLATIKVGDSDVLQIGQKVLALGNPFGLEGTLTSGIISGLRRPMQTQSGFIVRNLIQTDAAINPGNSGGPLLNSSGELVGINVMIVSPTGGNVGIGFSIPSNVAKRIVGQIIEGGTVMRGWIELDGVALDSQLARDAGLNRSKGLLVTYVEPGGNAEKAGLHGGEAGKFVQQGSVWVPIGGDIIVAVEGHPVTTVIEYLGSLEATRPGDVVSLTIVRGTKTIELPVVLTARPEG